MTAINRIIKKNILISVMSFIIIILFTTGISYALFIKEDTNTHNQVINVGSIDASLSSSTGVLSINNLTPKNATELDKDENIYSFTVTNTGDYTLRYIIYLTDNTDNFLQDCKEKGGCPDFSDVAFGKENYKYIHYRLDNNEYNFKDIQDTGKMIIGSGTILSHEAKTYNMQIWLDYLSPNDVIGKTASFNIKLEATAIDSPIKSTSEELNVGDIVTIGNEEFYVLSTSFDSVRMISRYNISETSIGDETYPIQNSSILENTEINFTDEQHCNSNICNIEYQGSLLQEKINEYIKYLREQLGADVVGDAPTLSDVDTLTSIPNYISTSFWTKEIKDEARNVIVYENGEKNSKDARSDYSGIRPVILTKLKNVDRKLYLDSANINVDISTLKNSKLTSGSIVSIGEEYFYVISENNGIVRMLAKENLYCGSNIINKKLCTIDTISQQNITDENIGIPFSSEDNKEDVCIDSQKKKSYCYSSYKNSDIEYYTDLYKEALYSKYQVSLDTDLLDELDLKKLDYSNLTQSFRNESYSWVYSTNFWTKVPIDNENLYAITKNNSLEAKNAKEANNGLRPVVVIHMNQIYNLPKSSS